ncbi:hypothetical protein LZ24_02973 [Desulfobotulus alkaliphilus]|uniref:Uncharacterized protein n=1 Tax=Desulfobotulus alkaliphilus TaxID=622671 RepID=A0A562R9R1_9BACT|nr:hypothetical protein [Desulfobotulus alkaliphilus]TWI65787.1 hypothetical protein LZ24_02973 [Desulfobotulus alkaliphilus]
MSDFKTLDPELRQSLEAIVTFVETLSGVAPSQKELALVLGRYFVKKEICDTLLAERSSSGENKL